MRLMDITGQESGIVVYPEGDTIVANWGDHEGLPSVFMDGLVFMPAELTVVDSMTDVDLSVWLAGRSLSFQYDRNGDLPLPAGTTGDMFVLEGGVTVMAPKEWH